MKQRHVDMLARAGLLATEQRSLNGHRRVQPGPAARGPVCPNPVTEQYTSRGLSPDKVA